MVLCAAGLIGRVTTAEASLLTNQPLADGEYVSVQDGHFVYKGERLRLWGTNYVSFVMRSGADLDLNMDRLVDAGFNGIRLNLFDRVLIPDPGKDAYVVPKTSEDNGTRRVDLLDNLDRSIYEAKQRGVFFWFTFDLRWKAQPSDYDILPDSGTREAWVAMSKQYPLRYQMFFDPRAERIYERFAGSLLDHYNAYTGRRCADEEAIALWEITNENGFIDHITAKQPDGLAKTLLTERWNTWLSERYETDRALREAWGGLSEGESISDASVVFAPLRDTVEVESAGHQITYVSKSDSGSAYSAERASDVIRFATDLFIDHSQRFTRFFRAQGKGTAVAPITPTGRYGNSWPMSSARPRRPS